MTANELAKELEACFTKADWNVLEAATVLRQQADRIAELENLNESLRKSYESAVDYSNELRFKQSEPVAWMKKQYSPDVGEYIDYCENALPDYIPLYTTPHHASDVKQTKPLSGGEILEIASNVVCTQSLKDDWRIHFARAIEAKVRGEK